MKILRKKKTNSFCHPFQLQTFDETLGPGEELDARPSLPGDGDHVAVQDPMPSFKSADNGQVNVWLNLMHRKQAELS